MLKSRSSFHGMNIKPLRKILQSILAILQHGPEVAILNAVSDQVFLNFESGFLMVSPAFLKDESGFFSSPSPGFLVVRVFFESESGSESESGFRSMPTIIIQNILVPLLEDFFRSILEDFFRSIISELFPLTVNICLRRVL